MQNRVGIDRQTFSQAKGNLLSAEARSGAFTFQALVPDDSLIEVVKEGVQQALNWRYGLGRFQSLGWGQFRLQQPHIAEIELPKVDGRAFRFRFQTPYVLETTVQSPEAWRQILENQLRKALQISPEDSSVVVERVIPRWRALSYVRRWSDESHQKLNRLVAEPGSELEIHFAISPRSDQMALWQWGIGEWLESGFGSFQFEPLTSETPKNRGD